MPNNPSIKFVKSTAMRKSPAATLKYKVFAIVLFAALLMTSCGTPDSSQDAMLRIGW